MVATNAQAVMRCLSVVCHPASTEHDMQKSVNKWLTTLGIPFRRELRISAQDRIDFMVYPGIGVECKAGRVDKRAAYRQLSRYAENDMVNALILVTATFMGLPEELNGKPVYLVHNGRAAF